MVVDCQCVITGSDMADRAAAMLRAGATYELVAGRSGRLHLPVVEEPAAALVDVAGGVVNVDAVRAFLTARAGAAVVTDRVYSLDITPTGTASVTSAAGTAEYDAVVVAAGATTAHIAAQVGIYTPPLLAHHVRLTFPVDGNGWQSWIDKPPGCPGTYQHQAGPGLWAVGGHVDPSLTAWEVGRESAIEASRATLLDYARASLAVQPRVC
jgi:sarcosine oxidase